MNVEDYLRRELTTALKNLGYPETPEINFEKPKSEDFGDLSTNVALILASRLKKNPKSIAEDIVSHLDLDSHRIQKVEVAGAGFINFTLGRDQLYKGLKEIISLKDEYGLGQIGEGRKVQVEFVSANPTGPLNVVNARAATVGDVLVNLFKAVGYDAKSEYYINDAGRQVRLLGESVSSRYCEIFAVEEEFPQEGYHGDYIKDLAQEIAHTWGDQFLKMSKESRSQKLAEIALEKMIQSHKDVLQQYRVHYDCWVRETAIRRSGLEEEVLKTFREKGLTYEKDGALWFKSSQFGDEKDRVLITKEGEYTYFFVDIAYHLDKYNRGFEVVYDLWGPDHHGYIDRMKAAVLALGYPDEALQVRIIQQVNLLRGGQIIKMSKRAGKIIEMKELIDEVGVDVARFFFLMRKTSAHLDFDIDLAKKQSEENPVYYVQYAHARVCNILKFAREQGIPFPEEADLSLLKTPEEINLIKTLLDYPGVVLKAARSLEPHWLTEYLQGLASVFHRFYHDHRVVTEDRELTKARLMLTEATRIVLANALRILNITAPERM